MAKITIIPNLKSESRLEQILNPLDFTVYIQRTNQDTSITTRQFSLDNSYTCEHHLKVGNLIGVTYLGVTQNITDATNGPGLPTYQVQGDNDLDLKLFVNGPATETYPIGLTNTVIHNDIGIKVKSLDLSQPFEVKLTPNTGGPTKDQSFWDVINNHKLEFKHYSNFIDDILSCAPHNKSTNALTSTNNDHHEERKIDIKRLPFNRTEGYSLLKFATEKYVERLYNLANYDEDVEEKGKFSLSNYLGKDQITPYYDLIKTKIEEYFRADNCKDDFLNAKADTTLIELIWSYWHEEGMVNQTMVALARRFQNIKNGYKDPMLNFALDPLRPLNNILWGYIQDAQHRLTATRRNYEYTGEYDLCVLSTMKPGFNPADRRSKFLQSFHRLIYEATEYFIQSDNTTIRPDGFKLLNAIRDTHRILAEGANNLFGNLPTVARIEMLIEQWILSRSEVREFLGGRIMVPYEEPWMDRVDSMKALQGWDNTSISFYRDLAVYGEKIILGIRYGNWTQITRRDHATNWADAFRDAIQRYIHSYYTVTGIDLAAPNVSMNSEEKYTLPGIHIKHKQNQFLRRS